jgi:hypothetical protein
VEVIAPPVLAFLVLLACSLVSLHSP